MLIRNMVMTISTTLILIVFITLTPVQAKSINENYFIDNHIKALLNKDISPVNKLPNLKIKVKTNNNQLNNNFKNNKISPFGNKFTMHPELYKETTHLVFVLWWLVLFISIFFIPKHVAVPLRIA